MAAPAFSNLDATQCIRGSFDEANGRLRVETAATIIDGAVEVAIDADSDNIAIKDPSSGNVLKINADGSINVDTSSVIGADVTITQGGNDAIVTADGALTVTGEISGTVNSSLEGLNDFQTSQYTVGTSVVQLTASPLSNRSSISFRVIATNGNAIYIGNNNALTVSNGYPLYNGDTLQMDLTPVNNIYAVGTAVGQTVCILEIA